MRTPIELIVHQIDGWPGDTCRVAAEYDDGVQLDLVMLPAERRAGLTDRAVALVDKLEANKLVQRKQSPLDRREVLVHITKRGETLLAALSELHSDQLGLVGPQLIDALSRVLSHHTSAKRAHLK